jgi:uncharacterized protein YegP (UPF0339 family)
MSCTFEIFKAPEGEFYFRLKAASGEPILSSQSFATKASAEHGVDAVRTNAPIHSHYDRRQTTDGFSFVVKSVSHQVIGRSELYPTAAARDAGMLLVKSDAAEAALEDQT